MKKTILIILFMLISSLFILPQSIGISEHEDTNGTTYGTIVFDNHTNCDYEINTNYNLVQVIYGENRIGQTFTVGAMGVNDTYFIDGFYVKISRSSNLHETIYFDFNNTNISTGKPTTNIQRVSIDSNDIDTSYAWFFINLNEPYKVSKGTTYSISLYNPDGDGSKALHWLSASYSSYSGGSLWLFYEGDSDYSFATRDVTFAVFNNTYNVTRTVSTVTEVDNIDFVSSYNQSGNVTLKIPVSTNVRGIIDVTNNSGGGNATQVNNLASVTNHTFYFDATNYFVYIGTINITYAMAVNWTINCSYGANFSINIPSYLTLGEYLIMQGMIENGSGIPINGLVAQTFVYYENGSIAIGDNPSIKWNCTNGNYESTISTTSLEPGVYTVEIEFLDSDSGITFRYGDTLYLSYNAPSGVYSNSVAFISFYNTNLGLGLPIESLQRYIDGTIQYTDEYYTYIGDIINVTIKDYYNTTLYQNNFSIDTNPYPIKLGLTFHEYDFSNMKEEYYVIGFLKTGATRWFEKIVPSRGYESFLMPTGNYTIRVYNADNSTYTSWSETVNNSKGYTIDGSNITQVIEGLSVVEGQVLELNNQIDYALMPDATIWCHNPPSVFSVYDKTGMLLGADVWKGCPLIEVIGTTRNSTLSNSIESHPLIPTNGTTENGTITIEDDVLYISGNGSINYVNITYTDNSTLMQNTTYIPSKINLNGENLTINASHNIHVLRETTFSKEKKFDWDIYNSTTNPGHINGRSGYHGAVLNIENTLNVPLYDVYVYIAFFDETTPDLNTVRVEDLENNIVMERGEDFKTTNGIEFKITGGMNASSNRSFKAGYYKHVDQTYIYENAQIEVAKFEKEKTLSGYDPLYNYGEFTWINDNSKTFRGSLMVKVTYSNEIDKESVKIYDYDRNTLIDDSDIIVGDEFVIISATAMGDVVSGEGRTYGLYFTETIYPGVDLHEIHLTTPVANIAGIIVTPFLIILILGLIPIIIPVYCYVKTGKYKDKYGSSIILGVVIIVIFWLLQAKGI